MADINITITTSVPTSKTTGLENFLDTYDIPYRSHSNGNREDYAINASWDEVDLVSNYITIHI